MELDFESLLNYPDTMDNCLSPSKLQLEDPLGRPPPLQTNTTELQPPQPREPTRQLPEDEDWTQIHDMGQRRRIQNRLAQRSFRMFYP